ncbi:bZIP transcription factor TGA10 [Linum perenne]
MAATNNIMEDQQHQNYHHHHLHQQDQFPNYCKLVDGSGGGGAYDLPEELDQALFMYLDGPDPPPPHHNYDAEEGIMINSNSSRPPPTLNIFPSHPMNTKMINNNNGTSTAAAAASPPHLGVGVPTAMNPADDAPASTSQSAPKSIKREGANRKATLMSTGASNSEQRGPKAAAPDPKTLRRLAQNREAARKSRLRKKAYVQQLESSRIKLSQLEQELHRARSQVINHYRFYIHLVELIYMKLDAAMFDMEYGRWLEEHHRLTCELRAAVDEHLPENDLRMYVDNCLAHYDVVLNLKGMVAKTDVFHLVSGMWKSPAERCFMWIGGFRPSQLIKIVANQIKPLTEQQIMGICGMQQSTHDAEEALSLGIDGLNHSLSETIASDSLSSCEPNIANYMGQMAMAINKLSTFESFVRQADHLRHETLHRLHQILTTRQAARCFLAIAEYFHRLRALSSLWLSRPRQD